MCAKNFRKERGSAMVEFVVCFALFWVPLFMGTYQIGFTLIREVQVTQLCRDAGHMYAQRTDFGQPSYQQLLAKLAPASFNMSSTGNTIFYFTTVSYVDDSSCQQGGLQNNTTSCPNYHQMVITQQIPLGNPAVISARPSNFGTPSTAICKASNDYVIQQKDYLKDPTAVAKNVPIPLSSSTQFIYAAEIFVNSSDLTFWHPLGTSGNYAQSFF